MMNRKMTVTVMRIALLVLMAATLAFIFTNSAMPPEASGQQSDTVQDAILNVVPPKSDFATLIKNSIRKLAHFFEYGLLGAELSIYVIAFERRRIRYSPLLALVPLVVGFLDETIQIASGREPSIKDVWIDIGGFVSFAAIVFAVFGVIVLVGHIRKRRAAAISENSNG